MAGQTVTGGSSSTPHEAFIQWRGTGEPPQTGVRIATTFGKGHHLHLIDGSAYIFRAYHALPPLTRKSDGLPVGAVAGSATSCGMSFPHQRRQPHPSGGGFDYSSTTFRNAIYPEYKANRPPPPEDLRPQFPLTRDATRAFNVACLEVDGYEADDIIATLARQAVTAGGSCTIISSDKDLMQLVRPGIDMFDPMKSLAIGPDQVIEKFGSPPKRWWMFNPLPATAPTTCRARRASGSRPRPS